MELAKTRMQTQGVGMRRKSKLLTYSGPVDCLKKIYKREGLPGLSRGLGLTVLRESPSFGVYFMSYECISSYLKSKSDSTVSTGVLLLSGGLAGQCSWLSTYPVDVIKTRIQNDSCGEYRNALHCVQRTWLESGFSGFFRGLSTTMLRAFPVNAATFLTVTWVIEYGKSRAEEDQSLTVAQHAALNSQFPGRRVYNFSYHF